MKLLFDQGTPAPLRRFLDEHDVDTLAEKGWSDKDNGALLDLAASEGYEVFVTTDQNLRYQQNLAGRQVGIVVLLATAWPEVRLRTREINQAIAWRTVLLRSLHFSLQRGSRRGVGEAPDSARMMVSPPTLAGLGMSVRDAPN